MSDVPVPGGYFEPGYFERRLDALVYQARNALRQADRIAAHIERIRILRDRFEWSEPSTVEELRFDARVQLRNGKWSEERYGLELAAALILVVADDQEQAGIA